MLEGGTGYVKVADFTPATAEDVRTQVEALEARAAPRTCCSTCAARPGARPPTASRWPRSSSRAARWRSSSGRRTEERLLQADAARSAWSGPLAVLVDNGTAGPGEIVAAALLDAGRAKLVGEHTFGRAAVSKTVALPEGGLVLTVAKYVSPKGTSIHGEGLEPSVPVAAEREEDEDLPEGAPSRTASSRRRSRS